jgi:hypothetical protein
MALSFTTLARNAILDSIETYAGTAAVVKVYQMTTGSAVPAADTAAVPGTVLATSSIVLPPGGRKVYSHGDSFVANTQSRVIKVPKNITYDAHGR